MRATFTTLLLMAGTPAFAQTATVTINPGNPGAKVTDQILGMNMANWFDPTQSGAAPPLKVAGIKAIRWPGGSAADSFHWSTNSECNGGYVDSNATFANLFADFVKPDKLDVAVTVNYGSNAACNAGGDPTEAAGWVASAKSNGQHVSHWTVGNEVYGSWEYDLHSVQHDAATYAGAVASGYYPDMKAANPKALVGVVAEPNWNPPWDPIVPEPGEIRFRGISLLRPGAGAGERQLSGRSGGAGFRVRSGGVAGRSQDGGACQYADLCR